MNREKYELLIQEISQLKRGDRKKEPKDYQLLKRYDVVQIGNKVKLIYPVAERSSLLQKIKKKCQPGGDLKWILCTKIT